MDVCSGPNCAIILRQNSAASPAFFVCAVIVILPTSVIAADARSLFLNRPTLLSKLIYLTHGLAMLAFQVLNLTQALLCASWAKVPQTPTMMWISGQFLVRGMWPASALMVTSLVMVNVYRIRVFNAALPIWMSRITQINRLVPTLAALLVLLTWPVFISAVWPDPFSIWRVSVLVRQWATYAIPIWFVGYWVLDFSITFALFRLVVWLKRNISTGLKQRALACAALVCSMAVIDLGGIGFLCYVVSGAVYPFDVVCLEIVALLFMVHTQLSYICGKITVEMMNAKSNKLKIHHKAKSHQTPSSEKSDPFAATGDTKLEDMEESLISSQYEPEGTGKSHLAKSGGNYAEPSKSGGYEISSSKSGGYELAKSGSHEVPK